MESQFLNCSSSPSVGQLKRANLSNTIFSIVCLAILLLLLALLVLYKAYRTTLQRLLVYITVSTALSVLDTISSVELQFDIDPRVCMWIGFGDIWSNTLIEFFSFGFVVCLIATSYHQLRGMRCKFRREWFCCMKHKVLTEVVYTCATVLFPLTFLWVPLYHQSYGLSETVCFMKTYDDQCRLLNQSRVESISLQFLGLAFEVVIIVSFLVLIVVFSLLIVKLKRSSENYSFKTSGRTIFLIAMLCISLVLKIANFVVNCVRILDETANVIEYDAIDNPVYIVSNIVIPVGFATYLYPPSRLRPKSLRRAARKWMCCQCHRKKKKTRTQPPEVDRYGNYIYDDHEDDISEGMETSPEGETDFSSRTTTYTPSLYTPNDCTDMTEHLVSTTPNSPKAVPCYGTIQTQT